MSSWLSTKATGSASFLTAPKKNEYVFSDCKRRDDIALHPSPSFPFLPVFSDYKRGDDILLHPSPSFPFLHVFSDYKRGDDISLHPPPSFPSLYVFSDYKRGEDISLHPPPSFPSLYVSTQQCASGVLSTQQLNCILWLEMCVFSDRMLLQVENA